MKAKAKPREFPYVLHARWQRPPDKHPRSYVVKFETVDQAGLWLRRLIGNDLRGCLADPRTFNLNNGIKVTSDRMKDVFDAIGAEGCQLTDEDLSYLARFKYGTWDEVHQAVNEAEEEIKPSSPKAERTKRAGRPAGFVTITELCKASGMPAMLARAALRASGRTKPPFGWAFDPKEVPEIKRICGMK